jgi:hypothetical protein
LLTFYHLKNTFGIKLKLRAFFCKCLIGGNPPPPPRVFQPDTMNSHHLFVRHRAGKIYQSFERDEHPGRLPERQNSDRGEFGLGEFVFFRIFYSILPC